jgi:HptB-dependent secretion and biofilm anti anti-sigma factor
MDYQLKQAADALEIIAEGKITMRDHEVFQEIAGRFGVGKERRAVIDLSKVDFIDSAGFGLLLVANDHAGRAGMTLSLRKPQPHVQQLLDLGDFGRIIPIEK